MIVSVDPHPHLALTGFVTRFPSRLAALPMPPWLLQLLRPDATAPVQRDEATRAAVRNLLRHGGYKPTGRGKPASEYLLRAASDGTLRSINAAVDAGNAAALHSGLPVSVVDVDRLAPPLHVGLAGSGCRFVFNEAGQEIDVEGLLCLHDVLGPCANAVKDAQRSKTHGDTRATLSLVWGAQSVQGKLITATAWYRQLLESLGADTEEIVRPHGAD